MKQTFACRNIIAICLSFVMMCCPTVCSYALSTEYADPDITLYPEAVEALDAMNILRGLPGGDFNLKSKISRAEAAAIVSRLVLTPQVADSMIYIQSRFSDMQSTQWAIKYVEACAEMAIIDGYGNDSFDPTRSVTGYEFSKMLLIAMGYGEHDEYIGTAWAENVAETANAVGLFKGIASIDKNAPATREECAQYAFNALPFLEQISRTAVKTANEAAIFEISYDLKLTDSGNPVGRWSIPEVSVDVFTYDSISQEVVDKHDSAAIFNFGSMTIIADHVTQGFDGIKECTAGMNAYLETGDMRLEYVCIASFPGHNTGSDLTDIDYHSLKESNEGGITCYTCNGNWKDVWIVFFQPVS